MAESHSDPGAAAAQEEAEEGPGVGAGSVLSALQVTFYFSSSFDSVLFVLMSSLHTTRDHKISLVLLLVLIFVSSGVWTRVQVT